MLKTKISQSQTDKSLAPLNPNLSESVPSLTVEPTTQAVSVEDPSPTISTLWDRAVQQAVINTAVGPTIASRAYAIVHTAIFDAWAAYAPKAIATRLGDDLQRPEAEITEANKEEAMSFAAYRVSTELFPDQVEVFDELMVELGFDPDNTTTDTATAAGIGNVSAEALLEFRREDGSNQEGDAPNGELNGYEPVNLPGDSVDIESWTPELVPIDAEPGEEIETQQFLTPQWGDVTPFALESGKQFRPEAPEPFLLVDGTVDLEAKTITLKDSGEVLITQDLIGDFINPEFIEQAEAIVETSANLTDEQKLIAEFWEDGAGTPFPPGIWMTFGEFVSARDNNTLDEDAQLFFSLGNSVFDAGIATWEAKTYYDYTRPVRAVRELGELGLIGEFDRDLNGYAIEAWAGPEQGTQTILATDFISYQTPGGDPSPPFAEYPSGHSAFSAAGAEILRSFTGSDEFGADVTFEPGESRFESGVTPQETVTLSWDSFTEAVNGSGTSRIYGGIHFNDGDLNGRQLGRDVGQTVWEQAQFFIRGGEPENPDVTFPGTAEDGVLDAANVNKLLTGAENNLANVGLASNHETLTGRGDRISSNGDDSLLNSDYLQSDGASLSVVEHDCNVLSGSAGADIFAITNRGLPDEARIVTDFELGKDIIDISGIDGISSINDLSFNQIGDDTVIDFNGTDVAILQGIQSSELLAQRNFAFV